MATLTKVGPKYQVTIPKTAREAVGLKVGDFVEAEVTPMGIMLRPKLVLDRKVEIRKRLAVAETDVKEGRTLGPFKSATAAVRAMKKRAHARGAK